MASRPSVDPEDYRISLAGQTIEGRNEETFNRRSIEASKLEGLGDRNSSSRE
jgi:hypothetical protein